MLKCYKSFIGPNRSRFAIPAFCYSYFFLLLLNFYYYCFGILLPFLISPIQEHFIPFCSLSFLTENDDKKKRHYVHFFSLCFIVFMILFDSENRPGKYFSIVFFRLGGSTCVPRLSQIIISLLV